MTGAPDLGSLYGECRLRVVELVTDLTPTEAAQPVPACPGWSVHDVIAHLTGVAADALDGRMDGAPGPEWTGRQVAARRARTVEAILHEWDRLAARFEQSVSMTNASAAVSDIASHEQDLRAALDVPGHRDNEAIQGAAVWMTTRFSRKVAGAGLPAVRIVTEDGERIAGEGPPQATVELPRFELFRATFGRRSADQVVAMFDGADGRRYVDCLCVFGPATADITE